MGIMWQNKPLKETIKTVPNVQCDDAITTEKEQLEDQLNVEIPTEICQKVQNKTSKIGGKRKKKKPSKEKATKTVPTISILTEIERLENIEKEQSEDESVIGIPTKICQKKQNKRSQKTNKNETKTISGKQKKKAGPAFRLPKKKHNIQKKQRKPKIPKKSNKPVDNQFSRYPMLSNFKIPRKKNKCENKNDLINENTAIDNQNTEIENQNTEIFTPIAETECFDSAGVYAINKFKRRHNRHSDNVSKSKIRCFDAAGLYSIQRKHAWAPMPLNSNAQNHVENQIVNCTKATESVVVQSIQRFHQLEMNEEVIEKFENNIMYRYHSMLLKEYKFLNIEKQSFDNDIDRYLNHMRMIQSSK